MSSVKFDPRTITLLVLILLIGAIRIIFNFNHDISPIANFSPLGAMALFGGAYFNKHWKAICFPLLTLFISDFILHQTVFKGYGNGILYGGWQWVYVAILLMTLIGRRLLKKVSVYSFLLSAFLCVLIHWIVTDLGVWMGSTVYAQNFQGFMNCLTAAIPFEGRFLTGTLVYGAILFGSFELMKQRFGHLAMEK